MSVKKALVLCTVYTTSFALEIGIGYGDFSVDFGLHGIMKADVTLAVTSLQLREHHAALGGSFYLEGAFDLYRSQSVDDMAERFDRAIGTGPFGFSPESFADAAGVPVPVNYQMHGIDVTLGAGYDLLENGDGSFLGIGIATGISMPYMETKNLLKDATLFNEMLERTKTDIHSYKLLPTIKGRYTINALFTLEGTLRYGWQYGTIANDYLTSDADFEGTLGVVDISVRLTPVEHSGFCLVVGYRQSDWNVETMQVNLLERTMSHDFSNEFDLDFASKLFYLNAGWMF